MRAEGESQNEKEQECTNSYAGGENCIMVNKPGKGLAYNNWIVDLYNMLEVFFKVN